MNYTFTHWVISNNIAKPKLPPVNILAPFYERGVADFKTWAETQIIPAPGIPDQTISVDEVKIVWQRNNLTNTLWKDAEIRDYELYGSFEEYQLGGLRIGVPSRRILRLKAKPMLLDPSYSQGVTEIGGESNNEVREALEDFVNACYTGCNKEELNKLRINAEKALKN